MDIITFQLYHFDSDICETNEKKKQTFWEHIFEKEKLVFFIETKKMIYGYYFALKIEEKMQENYYQYNNSTGIITENNYFAFSFKNKQAQKFVLKEQWKQTPVIGLYPDRCYFDALNYLKIERKENHSINMQESQWNFNDQRGFFPDCEDDKENTFKVKRILVFQLKE